MSDPDGNDGLMPDRADVRTRAPEDGEWTRPDRPHPSKTTSPDENPHPSRRRKRRRRRSKDKSASQFNAGKTHERAPAASSEPSRKQPCEPERANTDARPAQSAEEKRINGKGAPGPGSDPSNRHRHHRGRRGHPTSKDRSFHKSNINRGARELYAALDLGTNNCRLLIAEPRGRGFRVVDAFSRIVRLGEGVSSSGTLRSDAMDRAIDALRVCRKKLRDRGVRKARLVATEACRAAGNGQHFLDRVRDETDLELEVLSRGGEAKLAVLGCSPLIDHRDDGALLFDIGGGSSEIAWIDLKRRHRDRRRSVTDCILNWTSLPVGVVTLSEKFGGEHVTPDVFEAMIQHVDEMLEEAGQWGLLKKAISRGRAHFIGTSGTVTTIAGVHLKLERYDRRQVDGIWLNDGKIDSVVSDMLAMTYPERVGNACIGADRADLVLAGCAILEAIRRRWPCRRLRVADRGLREGILLELMTADGVWRRRPDERNGGN